jgi:hypothetical protein
MKRLTVTARHLLPSPVFRLVPACLMAALWVALAGCGGSSSSSSSTPAPTHISVASVTGHVNFDGVWNTCRSAGGPGTPDQLQVHTVSSTSVSYVTTDYTSINQTCTGVASTPSLPQTATASSTGDKTATGWSDLVSIGTTPPTANSGGSLPAVPTVTLIAIPSASAKTIVYIDDTATPWQLYSDCSSGSCTTDANGFPDYLDSTSTDRWTKQ